MERIDKMVIIFVFLNKYSPLNCLLSRNCSYLPTGIDSLSIEIYDECLLTSDDLIAWGTFKIPERHLTFAEGATQNTFEETIVLSGKQGDDKEGIVLMVFTLKVRTSFFIQTIAQCSL